MLFSIAVIFLNQRFLFAQTTNVIPTNIFLTDDGKVFWYKSNGERVIHLSTVTQAQDSKESQLADKDPEGHWGLSTNGFQLSLRFEKNIFTNGESVVATVLMRNVSAQSESYFRPIRILAVKDGQQMRRKNDTGIINITMSPETTIYPQTQHKYRVDLAEEYDLSTNGGYIFTATCTTPAVFSQPVSIFLTNAVGQ